MQCDEPPTGVMASQIRETCRVSGLRRSSNRATEKWALTVLRESTKRRASQRRASGALVFRPRYKLVIGERRALVVALHSIVWAALLYVTLVWLIRLSGTSFVGPKKEATRWMLQRWRGIEVMAGPVSIWADDDTACADKFATLRWRNFVCCSCNRVTSTTYQVHVCTACGDGYIPRRVGGISGNKSCNRC